MERKQISFQVEQDILWAFRSSCLIVNIPMWNGIEQAIELWLEPNCPQIVDEPPSAHFSMYGAKINSNLYGRLRYWGFPYGFESRAIWTQILKNWLVVNQHEIVAGFDKTRNFINDLVPIVTESTSDANTKNV